MKAWLVFVDPADGCYLVHADTRNKARVEALHTELVADWGAEYEYIHAKRCPKLDDLPFTLENAEKVLEIPDDFDEDGQPYTGEYCTRSQWQNQCLCPICKTSEAMQ